MINTKLRAQFYEVIGLSWPITRLLTNYPSLPHKPRKLPPSIATSRSANVYYVDPDNGNDANTGLSFAQRWKTFLPGKNIVQGGDTVRVIGSAVTNTGVTGTWTAGGERWLNYYDAVFGVCAITASTNVSPVGITTAGTHGLATGDWILISGTSGVLDGTYQVQSTGSTTLNLKRSDGTNTAAPGSTVSTGVIYKLNYQSVNLASANSQAIALDKSYYETTAWTVTDGANMQAYSGPGLFGPSPMYIDIFPGWAGAPGKVAYFATGTLNLSAYQQVSFMLNYSSTVEYRSIANAKFQLKLCSDTAGNTAVHTIDLPAAAWVGYNSNQGIPFVKDFGTNLSSSIQSIALYCNSAITGGASNQMTVVLRNIIAIPASSAASTLSHKHLISKNGTEEVWPISAIMGTHVLLGSYDPGNVSSSLRSYGKRNGTSGSGTIYKIDPIQFQEETSYDLVSTGMVPCATIPYAGQANNPILIEGGWDRTNMSSQTLSSWAMPTWAFNEMFYHESTYPVHISLNKLNAVFPQGTIFFPLSMTFGTVEIHGTLYIGTMSAYGPQKYTITNLTCQSLTIQASNSNITSVTVMLPKYYFFSTPTIINSSTVTAMNFLEASIADNGKSFFGTFKNCEVGTLTFSSNLNGAVMGLYRTNIDSLVSVGTRDRGSGMTGFSFFGLIDSNVYSISSTGTTGTTYLARPTTDNSGSAEESKMTRSTFRDITYTNTALSTYLYANDPHLRFEKAGSTNTIFGFAGTCTLQSTITYNGTSAWKIDRTETYGQFAIEVGQVSVVKGLTTTIRLMARRESTTSTVRLRLMLADDPTAGSATIDTLTANASTWQQLSISFTPRSNGVYKVFLDSPKGSIGDVIYFDELSVTQEAGQQPPSRVTSPGASVAIKYPVAAVTPQQRRVSKV